MLYEVITDCDENVRNVMDYLLCRTIIVKNLDAGIALKNRTRGAFHIATLEGDIISTGGSMSGGSLQKQTFNLLSRERELQELRAKLKKADAALEEKKSALRKGEQDRITSYNVCYTKLLRACTASRKEST